MKRWELQRDLDASSGEPLFLQLVRAVTADIAGARLAPGDRLPGSRTLAQTLRINRNTVLAAYAELAAEGWVVTRPAGGTFVASPLDPTRPRHPTETRAQSHLRAGYTLPPLALPDAHWELGGLRPGMLVMSRGAPDTRLFPLAELARAYRRVLLRYGRKLLFYGDPRGHERLRTALSTMVATKRGIGATPETLLVTRGSQMALDLVARALLKPGDVVAVEELGNPIVHNLLRLAGTELSALPVDAEGLSTDALERLARERPVRAVYVTPHHQFPTTTVMSASRRKALLALAARHRFAIIEDDYDHEFHYDARPVAPLASADHGGTVIYIATLSKIIAPGLRMGFVVAPADVIDRLAQLRRLMDIQGDLAMECAIAELFEAGEIQRHVHRVRSIYARRRDTLIAALHRDLHEEVTVMPPPGGMAVWAKISPPLDVETWSRAAEAHGVAFRAGSWYDVRGRAHPFTRLAFTFLDEAELAEAVRRMASAVRTAR